MKNDSLNIDESLRVGRRPGAISLVIKQDINSYFTMRESEILAVEHHVVGDRGDIGQPLSKEDWDGSQHSQLTK